MTAIAGSFKIAGDEVYTVKIDRDGKLSDSIKELKAQSSAFLTTLMATHGENPTAEVDVMEEVISDGEDAATPGSRSKKQRKQRGDKRKR